MSLAFTCRPGGTIQCPVIFLPEWIGVIGGRGGRLRRSLADETAPAVMFRSGGTIIDVKASASLSCTIPDAPRLKSGFMGRVRSASRRYSNVTDAALSGCSDARCCD